MKRCPVIIQLSILINNKYKLKPIPVKRLIMEILIILGVLIVFISLMGGAFQTDLKDMEKTHPKFRKHLKDRYDL